MTALPSNVPPELVRDYDTFTDLTIAESYVALDQRRAECPISWSDRYGGFWVVTQYQPMHDLLKDPELFINYPANLMDNLASRNEGGHGSLGQAKKLIPIELDGEEHRGYRKLMNPMYNPAQARELEPATRRLANELIDSFIDDGKCEFVQQFSKWLPGYIFLETMDWPVSDAPKMLEWVETMLGALPGLTEAERGAAKMQAGIEATGYLMGIIADRKANPRDDITSRLMRGDVNGAPIPDDDLPGLLLLLMLGGLDTVQSVLGQSFAYLAEFPEDRRHIFDADAVEHLVDELIRLAAPAQPTRNVSKETTIGDVTLKPGDRVHCPLGAANRDPSVFANPNRVVIGRPNQYPHLTFSMGPHRCVGAHIGRMELRVAMEEWHRRIPDYRLAPAGVSGSHTGQVWGLDGLHLEW